MSSWTTAGSWLLHCGAGGGLLLLLTCFLMSRTRQPALRQRLGEWGLAAALVVAVLSLVGPAWLIVEWPAAAQPAAVAAPLPLDVILADEPPAHDPEPVAGAEDMPPPAQPTPAADAPAAPWWQMLADSVLPWVVALYALGAAFLLGRWLLGHLALMRLLRATSAPPEVARLFAAMAGGPRPPRLLISRRLRVPVSCGLLRPTVVLPASMCERPAPRRLRWVFAHELTHLERRDGWSALLFALGQVVYFLLPWFWWQRRQVRLCQEYVADAAAAGQEPAADYAEFLLSLTGAPAAPRAATGVSGPTSDLFRRVRMLLQQPVRVEKRCPRRRSLAAGAALCALAVVLAGVGLRAEAAPQVIIIVPQERDGPKVLMLRTAEPAQQPGKVLFLRKGIREPQPVPMEAEAVRKALEFLARTQGQKSDLPKELKVKIKVDGATPIKELRKALDALQKMLKDMEKQGGAVDPAAIRMEAVKALARLGGKAVVANPVPVQPGDRVGASHLLELKLKLPPHGPGGVDMIPRHLLTADSLKKLREELKKHPDAAELLKALEAFERASAKPPGGNQPQYRLVVPGVQHGPFRSAENLLWYTTVRNQSAVALGLKFEKPSSALADQLDLPKGVGLLIVGVSAGSPAWKAGLKANDVLLSVNKIGVPSDPASFPELLKKLDGKGGLAVEVRRKGKRAMILVEAAPQPRLSNQPAEALLDNGAPRREGSGRQGDVMTTLFRNGDRFNTRYQEGSLIITLTGTVADGKAQLGEIVIQDGAVAHKYDSAARVPAQYRDKVNHLLEISARGQFRTERR